MYLDREKWQKHEEPIFTQPNGVLEDFTVWQGSRGELHATYCEGPSLQDMRLFSCIAESPVGPWGLEQSEAFTPLSEQGTHTRLYRSVDMDGRDLISAVWPGLPRCGMWLFTRIGSHGSHLARKELFIGPKYGSLYSVAAANPCVYKDPENLWHIYFEGRDENVYWRLFEATWDGQSAPVVIDEPLCDGANPSLFVFDSTVYLYYSRARKDGIGFDTCVMTQPL